MDSKDVLDVLVSSLSVWVCEECGSIISCRADDCRACGRKRIGGEQIIPIETLSWPGKNEYGRT